MRLIIGKCKIGQLFPEPRIRPFDITLIKSIFLDPNYYE